MVRPLVWKLLLRLHLPPATGDGSVPDIHPLLDAENYYQLILKPPSTMYQKIANDTFRTLATDLEFREKVGEDRLIRCLEAFVWRQLGRSPTSCDRLESVTQLTSSADAAAQPSPSQRPPPIDPGTPYVQGMVHIGHAF